jgi:tryptophan synthase alpha chain
MITQAKGSKDIPCAIGFGISTPDQARTMASLADGVIVGSAIVKIIGEYGEACVPYVEDYVRRMKEACLNVSKCE